MSALLPILMGFGIASSLFSGNQNQPKSFGSQSFVSKIPKGIGSGAGTMMPLAMLYSASMLGHWADTNVDQTGVISEDSKRKLDLQWAEFAQQDRYLNIRERELDLSEDEDLQFMDYETGMSNTIAIGNIDSEQQADRLQVQIDLDQQRHMIELKEKEIYATSKIFDDFQNILSNMGYQENIDDLYKLAWIIPAIESLLTADELAVETYNNSSHIKQPQYQNNDILGILDEEYDI